MRFKLVPTNDVFFDLFNDAAKNAAEGALRLRELVVDFTEVSAKHDLVVACERRGDEITKDLLQRLNTTFVTPFDREDIHAIAEELDDVLDDILAVSDLLKLLPIKEVMPELKEMADILVQMTDQTVQMFDVFARMRGIPPFLESIDRLESEGDSIYRRTLARLFRDHDAMTVLIWKDVFAAMEAALNTVEDISNIVESVVLKQA